jgi:hypothetical protein
MLAAPINGDSLDCSIPLRHVLTKPSILLESSFNVDSSDVLSEAVGCLSGTGRATFELLAPGHSLPDHLA